MIVKSIVDLSLRLIVILNCLQIYTDWANRYLAKYSHAPIHDLTYDLRDPKVLVHLVNAVSKQYIVLYSNLLGFINILYIFFNLPRSIFLSFILFIFIIPDRMTFAYSLFPYIPFNPLPVLWPPSVPFKSQLAVILSPLKSPEGSEVIRVVMTNAVVSFINPLYFFFYVYIF